METGVVAETAATTRMMNNGGNDGNDNGNGR
jgi:hypothetical protein